MMGDAAQSGLLLGALSTSDTIPSSLRGRAGALSEAG